jgi:hypothetical protein
VRVDQAGHQGPAAAVDPRRTLGGDRLHGYGLDEIASHQDIRRRREFRTASVEDPHVLEQDIVGDGRGRNRRGHGEPCGPAENLRQVMHEASSVLRAASPDAG